MRKSISLIVILSAGVSFVFSGVKSLDDKTLKVPAKRMYKEMSEPMNDYQSSSVSGHGPNYTDNDRNSYEFFQVDESKNGYGMIVAPTKPIYLNPDAGLFLVYRQWAGDAGTSGQIGASLCVDCWDGTVNSSWTTYTNLNGAMEIGRYPSALGNADYPYAIWNEYTGTGAPSYGGRPYYAFDEFGWDGGSFTQPQDTDLTWNDGKDLWVGSPTHDVDANGNDVFNVCLLYTSDAADE